MTRLSIVIPCDLSPHHFESTLASVLQNRPPDCEVLVVQPRAYDDPYDLKDEVRFEQASSDATLIDLINVGIERSQGDVLHLLTCDVEVSEGWTDGALAHFRHAAVWSVAPRLVFHRGGRQRVACGVHLGWGGLRRVTSPPGHSPRAHSDDVLAPTLWAGFYRRQTLVQAGGFSAETGTACADIDLGLSMQRNDLCCNHEASCSIVAQRDPTVRQLSFAGGWAEERLFWRSLDRSQPGWALVHHACAGAIECLQNLYRPRCVLQALGRVGGWWERLFGRRPTDQRAALCDDRERDEQARTTRATPPGRRLAA